MYYGVLLLVLLFLPTTEQQKPSLLQRLEGAIYYGQGGSVEQTLSSISPKEANRLLNMKGSNSEHSIHLLLQGWHTFVESSFGLKANFVEGCARYGRTLDVLLAHGASASMHCPLVDAFHYRNRIAVDALLRNMNHSQIGDCFSVRDALGQTVLHVGCKATSAGSARIFAKIRTSLLAPGSPEEQNRRQAELQHILSFLSISHLPQWVNGSVSRSSLQASLLPWTLETVLERGLALRLALDWFDWKDFRGYTARDYAVRSGERWVRLYDDARAQAISYSPPLPASASCSSTPTSSSSTSSSSSSSCSILAPSISFASLFSCSSQSCHLSSSSSSSSPMTETSTTTTTPLVIKNWRQNISLALYQALQLHIFDSASSFAHIATPSIYSTTPITSSPLSSQQVDSKKNHNINNISDNINNSDSCASLRMSIDRLVYSSACHSEIWTRFHSDYVKLKRPVVLSQVDLSLPSPLLWDRVSVLKRYGDHNTSVGSIPYADTYGLPAEKMNLRKFVKLYMSPSTTIEKQTNTTRKKKQSVGGCLAASNWDLPMYVFDTSLPLIHPSHFQFAFLSLLQPPPAATSHTECSSIESLSDPLLPGENSRPISLRQFSLGPALSGSASHWHQTALNVLLEGLKLWFLFPPSSSFWSVVPPFHFLLCDYLKTCIGSNTTQDRFGEHVVVFQRPGEVIYVPDEWGHVVLNLLDSVAYAAEFFE